MSIYLRLVDHDALFEKAVNNPIIVNNYDLQSEEDLNRLNGMIYTTYSDDSLEILPRCDCGGIHGEYNVGIFCEDCGTLCLPVTERPLESVLWIQAPQGIDRLINPIVWIILSKRFMDGGINTLEWLTNPKLPVPPDKVSGAIRKLEKLGVERGLNYFYRNFDRIIDLLINGKVIKNGKLEEREELLQFIQENRHKLFSRYLPFPSKLVFIREKTPMGVYADKTMGPAIDAIRAISSIETSVIPISEKMLEARVIKATTYLAEYYETFFSKSLGPKEGWFRKHIYGGRGPFTLRAVISSISEPHHREDIHLPWSLSVMLFKLHLMNKLLKGSSTRRQLTPNEALTLLYESTSQYNPIIDQLFQELIGEAPGRGPVILLQRNPSLTRGSIQTLNLVKIKTDPEVNTIGVSTLILRAWNKITVPFDRKVTENLF